MKKFLALLLATYATLVWPTPERLCDLTSYIQDGTYSVCVEGEVYSRYATHVSNGGDSVLTCSMVAAPYLYADLGSVQGETVQFCGGQNELDRLVEALGFVDLVDSKIEGCYYGYSARLGAGVLLDGKKVNCQIVVQNGTITVGYPLILGSYCLT